jgi:hypothetical protein
VPLSAVALPGTILAVSRRQGWNVAKTSVKTARTDAKSAATTVRNVETTGGTPAKTGGNDRRGVDQPTTTGATPPK